LSWEEALVKENDGIHMNFPSLLRKQAGGLSQGNVLKQGLYETT
jgi:hypothetical protein